MTIQEQILEEFKKEQKGDKTRRDCFKYIVGEFQRQKTKKLSDDKTVRVLKQIREIILEEIELVNSSEVNHSAEPNIYLDIINSYIPEQKSEEEIRDWINNNIYFSKYKKKIEAMKEIMLHFGVTTDGDVVKDILMSMG